MSSAVEALASMPVGRDLAADAASCRAQRARTALTIAEPHDVVPIEPPASIAGGQVAVADLDARRASMSTSSASAAICVSTVRAPVPMSAAPMPTT